MQRALQRHLLYESPVEFLTQHCFYQASDACNSTLVVVFVALCALTVVVHWLVLSNHLTIQLVDHLSVTKEEGAL